MKPVFKIDMASALNGSRPFILELGCGDRRRGGRTGVDRVNLDGVDIVADLEEGLPFLPDNCADAVHAHSFLEHIDNLTGLMRDVHRVLKPGAPLHVVVPHFSNPYGHSDPTHKRVFGIYSFEYFCGTSRYYRRRVPAFYHDFAFRTNHVRLSFSSPWRALRILKAPAAVVFNLAPVWQEVYEAVFSAFIPCYAICVELTATKTVADESATTRDGGKYV